MRQTTDCILFVLLSSPAIQAATLFPLSLRIYGDAGTAIRTDGRHFLYQVDDVKNHLPEGTTDMSCLVYREWVKQVRAVRNAHAREHNLPVRNDRFGSETSELSLELRSVV